MAATDLGAQITALHGQQQAALAQGVATAVLDIVPALDVASFASVDASWPAVERALMAAIVEAYGLSSGLAINYYELFRAAEGVSGSSTPLLAEALPAERVATSLRVTGPFVAKALISAQDRDVIAKLLASLIGSSSRLSLAGGRNTLDRSGTADRQLLGWSRVCNSARPCAWCRMLRSRGPVYESRASALFRSDGGRYHDHCRCSAEPQYSTDASWVDGAREDRALWDEVTAGFKGKDALNAFRRAVYDGR